MNTNNITLTNFNSSLAIVIAKMAETWSPDQILTFDYEFLRIKIIDIAKKSFLIEEKHLPTFMKLILELSDYKMNSLRSALMEYSSVLHTL